MSAVSYVIRYRLIWNDGHATYLDSPYLVTTRGTNSAAARTGRPYVAEIERVGVTGA